MKEIHQGYIERDLAAVKVAETKLQAAVVKYNEAADKVTLASEAVIDARVTLQSATSRFRESVEASAGLNGVIYTAGR